MDDVPSTDSVRGSGRGLDNSGRGEPSSAEPTGGHSEGESLPHRPDTEATIIPLAQSRDGSVPQGHIGQVRSDETIVNTRPGNVKAPTNSADSATIVGGSEARTSIRRSPRPASGGVAVRTAVELEIGTVLGNRYEILELLGEGGMGAVYKAADLEVDRLVALKVIRPELASHPEILARFKQELLLSSQVTHRNVIRIYDLGEAEGVKFITMEYIEGKDLRSILHEKKKFAPQQAVDVAKQVCHALEATHSLGIIHRDLKPQNV